MTYRSRMDDRWAIVVPGSGRLDTDGCYRIGPRARACLRVAAQLAHRRRPRVVVLSGWSPVGGATEAHQMLNAWDGPDDVEVVLEPSATITAENMCRSLPHLLTRHVREATIVCGLLHLPRVRYHFGGVYPRHGIRCSYALTGQAPTPRALGWEAAAMLVMRRQRRAALAELAALLAAGSSDRGEFAGVPLDNDGPDMVRSIGHSPC
jgi:DUF218 domain-containing protein